MLTTKTIFIIIVSICVVVFLVAVFSILKKKKGGKKEKKASEPKSDEVKPETLKKREPKINKKKLEQMASSESKVAPAFSKDELEEERKKALAEQIEKSKASNTARQGMPFPNFGGNFQFPMPNMQKPLKVAPTPSSIPVSRPVPTMQKLQEVPEVKQEDKDFVEALKQRGVIERNKSFGESLIIKEAIETPVSKQAMKQKRNKWM